MSDTYEDEDRHIPKTAHYERPVCRNQFPAYTGPSTSDALGIGALPSSSTPYNHREYTQMLMNGAREFREKQRIAEAEAIRNFPIPTKAEIDRDLRLESLESLENVIRILHFNRQEELIKFGEMEATQKNSVTFLDEETGRANVLKEDDYSMVRGVDGDAEFFEMRRRENEENARPVYIDGFSIIRHLFSTQFSELPKLSVKIFIDLLAHFVMEGHFTKIFLPSEYYGDKHLVDDNQIFNILLDLNVFQFLDSRNFEEEVLREAERTRGIMVTKSESLHSSSAFICIPVFLKTVTNMDDFTKIDDFVISTVFLERKMPEAEAEAEDNGLSNQYVRLSPAQTLYQSRFYSEGEYQNTEGVSLEHTQITLKRQVFLISILLHLSKFNCNVALQMRIFLVYIKTYVPKLLPEFMGSKVLEKISSLREELQNEKMSEEEMEEVLKKWPIVQSF